MPSLGRLRDSDWAIESADGTAHKIEKLRGALPPSRVRIATSTGGAIEVELFERDDGAVQIRSLNGQLEVWPEAGNVIAVRVRGR